MACPTYPRAHVLYVPTCPTCPSALRAVPYVPTLSTCPTCRRAQVYFTDQKIKYIGFKLDTHSGFKWILTEDFKFWIKANIILTSSSLKFHGTKINDLWPILVIF